MATERIRQINERELEATPAFRQTCSKLSLIVGNPLQDPNELKTARRQHIEADFLARHGAMMTGYGSLERFDGVLLDSGVFSRVDASYWEDFVLPRFEFPYESGVGILEVARWYPSADDSGIMVRGNNVKVNLPGEVPFSITNGTDGKKRFKRGKGSGLISTSALQQASELLEAFRVIYVNANVSARIPGGHYPKKVGVVDVITDLV